jgi:FKBP-type peptidyl-prolyl cis-trans isomerase FklB
MIMKKISITLLCLSLAAPLFADGTNQLADEKSRVSYAIGMSLAHNSFKRQGLDLEAIDPDLIGRAIKDVLSGGTELMTEAQMTETLKTFQTELRTRVLAKNKAQGEAFLTTNKLAPGIKLLSVSTPAGKSGELQYLVITNGTGPVPAATDKVSVNYRGTLLDGTEFDSSYKRGKPGSFAVGGVIPGWSQALQKMPVGSKWKLFIPSELGYGERGTPGIPPNSVLTFEVELLGIEATPPPKSAAPAAPAAPLTSDIIKVPSAEELKKGAKIEVIKPEDVQKAQQQQQDQK